MSSKYGNQYPTACVYLATEDDLCRSKSREASAYYSESGRNLLPWQSMLLEQIMAVNSDGLWVHADFGYTVPRRNGKSEDLIARIRWGLENGEPILYTAHRNDTSHDFYLRVEAYLQSCGFFKESELKKDSKIPLELRFSAIKAKGAESITLLKNNAKIDFRTRTATGGLGKAYGLVIIDEAQEYTSEQQSALVYVVTDYFNPQVIMCGTPPTLVSNGDVFKTYRDTILEEDVEDAGWAEWSVDERKDPEDREAWYLTNPSLGYILSERNIKHEIKKSGGKNDDIDFQIQRLGLWYTYQIQSAITEDVWNQGLVDFSKIKLKGKLCVGIKFGVSGENTCLSVACKTSDGKIFVQALACKPTIYGVSWIIELLKRLDYSEIVSDGANGQEMLENALKEAKLRRYKKCTLKDVIAAHADFETAINSGKILHSKQVALDRVVTNTKKRKIGNAGGFGYESIVEGYEVAILESVIFAYHSRVNAKDRKKQTVSY